LTMIGYSDNIIEGLIALVFIKQGDIDDETKQEPL
jgi:hypothetical protein